MAAYQRPSSDVSRYCEQRGFSFHVRDGGFGYLLDCWTKVVGEVETGYRGVFDGFLNDVDTRKIIAELATYASDEEWAAVEAELAALDGRFIAATRPVERCIWGEHNAAKHGYRPDCDWWYYHVP